jgi:hypothetical protein
VEVAMKKIIHVNQHNIKHNAKVEKKDRKNVLTVKTYKDNVYTDEVTIYGQDGKPAAKVVYSPDKPLSCGAKVWIETTNYVEVV